MIGYCGVCSKYEDVEQSFLSPNGYICGDFAAPAMMAALITPDNDDPEKENQ